MGDYEMGEKLTVLPCKHEFHCECIKKWLVVRSRAPPSTHFSQTQPTCPNCREKVASSTAAVGTRAKESLGRMQRLARRPLHSVEATSRPLHEANLRVVVPEPLQRRRLPPPIQPARRVLPPTSARVTRASSTSSSATTTVGQALNRQAGARRPRTRRYVLDGHTSSDDE